MEGIMETINHPQHYGGDTTYEVIKVIEAWDLSFNLGNTVKYIARAGRKPDVDPVEDLKKAQWYLMREIQRLERDPAQEYTDAVEREYHKLENDEPVRHAPPANSEEQAEPFRPIEPATTE